MSAASSGFAIDTERTDGDVVISVRGELDLSTAPELATAITSATAGGAESITLDLASITFIDSSALRVLVTGGRELRTAGKVLQIGARSAVVTRVLAMTNLDSASESFTLLPER